MEQLIVKDSVEVAAPADKLWRVMTEPALTEKFMFGCAAVTDWKVGSKLDWTAIVDGKPVIFVTGSIVACEPGRYLAYTTYGPGMGLADVPANYLTVTVRLTQSGDRTRLDVTQGDFAGAENGRERYDHTAKGWQDVLPKMKALAESL
jgi:uncharacterized protein YndB with AHSA1/START domain